MATVLSPHNKVRPHEKPMTYQRDLQDIEAACLEVFGMPIEVAPRALQALVSSFEQIHLLGNELARATDLECFRRVIASSPAHADALMRESSLEHLIPRPGERSTSPIRRSSRIGNFKKLLSDIFVSHFPFRTGLHPAGMSVQGVGRLTESDLFLACLQAGRRSVLPNRTASALLAAAGLIGDEISTQRGDKYLTTLELRLKAVPTIDQSHPEQQIILYLDDKQHVRMQIFGANAVGQLEERMSKIGTFVFRGGVLQPASTANLFTQESIAELEDLINSKTTLEQQYQAFFERHPEFLKALDFKKIHAQPILYKDDGSRLVPDFFLEQLDSGWHAIADLKRAHENMVIRRNNRVYFAQWVQDSIAQLHFYREWFESPKNRTIFESTQKVSTRVYRPKMVLIAGRASDFIDDVERIRLLSAQDANLSLWTYDAVLKRAKNYRAFAQGLQSVG